MKTVIGFLVWLVLRLYVWLARKPSFTFRAPDGKPYMTRWPLWTRDPWPDAQGRTGGEGLYLHKMTASDHERELHNHPAPGAALVLCRGYYEKRQEGRHALQSVRHRGPLAFHVLDSETFHRVTLRTTYQYDDAGTVLPSWSLFYIGPRRGPWGFLQPDGTVRRADHHDGNTGATVSRYAGDRS